MDAALEAGALGARMMGGGFGGSVLALVPAAAVGAVRGAVAAAFARHAWPEPEFLDAAPSASARRVSLRLFRTPRTPVAATTLRTRPKSVTMLPAPLGVLSAGLSAACGPDLGR